MHMLIWAFVARICDKYRNLMCWLIWTFIKWASTRENMSSGCREQQGRRPACISAQSDQRLCFLLFGKYHIQSCYRRNFNFLDSLCSWAGWFEPHFCGNPEDRFFRGEALNMRTNYFRILYHLHVYYANIIMFWLIGGRCGFNASNTWPLMWSTVKPV